MRHGRYYFDEVRAERQGETIDLPQRGDGHKFAVRVGRQAQYHRVAHVPRPGSLDHIWREMGGGRCPLVFGRAADDRRGWELFWDVHDRYELRSRNDWDG